MKQSVCYVSVILWCLLMTTTVLERHRFALVAINSGGTIDREVVNCYFGALRKDSQIMVNMVTGGAGGALYRITNATSVTLNGKSVRFGALSNGMPRVLMLNKQKTVDEIRIIPGGN